MAEMIDIAGLDKAELLAALFAAANPPQGIAALHYGADETLTAAEAREIFAGYTSANPYIGQPYFVDYVKGRKLHINIEHNSVDPTQYDRANGADKAQQVISQLRNSEPSGLPTEAVESPLAVLLANPEFIRLQALAAETENRAAPTSADDNDHQCPRDGRLYEHVEFGFCLPVD